MQCYSFKKNEINILLLTIIVYYILIDKTKQYITVYKKSIILISDFFYFGFHLKTSILVVFSFLVVSFHFIGSHHLMFLRLLSFCDIFCKNDNYRQQYNGLYRLRKYRCLLFVDLRKIINLYIALIVIIDDILNIF